MALRDTQELLFRLIAWPEGVPAALETRPDDARALGDCIRSDERLSAVERLGVYANAYFLRIHDALAEDFAALAYCVGAEPFHDLATSYLAVHPSRHPSLRFAGDRMADFLATHEAGEPFRRRWPWAADLALLEWALVDAFDAADAAPAKREDFASVAPERWAELQLAFDASVALLRLDWPVHDLHRAYREDAAAPEITPGPDAFLVWRKQESAVHRRVDPLEAQALAAALAGARFGDLCAIAAEELGEAEAAARGATWLGAWLEAGLLVSA